MKIQIKVVIFFTFALFIFLISGITTHSFAQQPTFTRADTLRGTITPQRAWWDVTYYDLHVTIHPGDSTIQGFNNITYTATKPPRDMQIDLQKPLVIDRIEQAGERLDFRRVGNAFFVEMPASLEKGSGYTVSVYYHGRPKVAENPPWDGGFIWARDSLGRPWIATANQGLGASVWWPNKDHQSEEPDSMTVSITVPDPLINVSNGRLRDTTRLKNGMTTYTWHVSNPINNYNIAVNAGNYVNFKDTYQGEKGTLDLSYWVLDYNLEKAKEQFKQVKPMMKCFEHWFGPYPFYEDSYKLVETPHLGMEHQSAVAYGNGYQNGYRGTDLSGTGWGLKWDFIIIHESGHEWWGNSITTKDVADMWVHEGFTNYSENLYVECRFGEEAGADYVIGTRSRIRNDRPVIGTYGVNQEGSGDMYYKGGNMLHTIRQIIDNDGKWRQILRGLQKKFRYQTVTTRQIENYISKKAGIHFDELFDQYLRHTDIPVLQYYIEDSTLYFRWKASVDNFDMPVKVTLSEETYSFIHPVTGRWNTTALDLDNPAAFKVDRNFYVETEKLSEKPVM